MTRHTTDSSPSPPRPDTPSPLAGTGETAAIGRLRRRLARGLWGGAGVLLAVLIAFGVTGGTGEPATGEPLPDFTLTTLDGAEVTRDRLLGQVVVLNVWASWCPPCRSEAPILREAWEASDAESVAFLGLIRNDNAADARDFTTEFGLGYPNALDDVALGRALGVRGLPTTYVIDAQGRITGQHFGPITASRLRVLIEDARSRSTAEPAG